MYEAPSIRTAGSLSELTLSTITKVAGATDVIIISGVPTPAQGATVISVS